MLAHFFLYPQLQLDSQVESLRLLLAAASEEAESDLPEHPNHEIWYITGQCDLLLLLDLPDLRFVSHLQKHLLGFPALSSTWVYSIPLEGRGPNTVCEPQEQDRGLPIHFVLYLRLRRPFYGIQDFEPAVIDKLYELLATAGIKAQVHLGMGWSDVLVRGSFDCLVERFFALLLAVEGIHLRNGAENQPILQRTLTLLGFPTGADTAPYVPLRAVIFGQTSPGQYLSAHAELTRRLGAELADSQMDRLLSLDGRYDFMVPLRPRELGGGYPNYVEKLFELANESAALRDKGVERLETHLLTVEVEELEPLVSDDELVLSGLNPLDQPTCRCSQHPFAELRTVVDRLPPDVYPEELKTTVSNVLTLFGYALNDPASCCDALLALNACAAGLRRLLDPIQQVHKVFQVRRDQQAYWYSTLEDMRDHLDSWCVLSERVLSERTAGSFLQFFDQTDRVASYRGGVQKLLHLADHLAAELYEGTRPNGPSIPGGTLLATIYEPIDTIQSERVLGVLKVPLRYRFTLSLVLPQIWHEVGQFMFSERYPIPLCRDTNMRLNLLFSILRGKATEDDVTTYENTMPSEIQERVARLREDAGAHTERGAPDLHRPLTDVDEVRLLTDLSDLYADLVVFTYGFLEDWPGFVHYLATLFFESKTKRNAPDEVWERHCMGLGMRLFFVTRFFDRKRALQDESQPLFWDRGGRKACAEEVVAAIRDVADKASYQSIELPADYAKRLFVNIASSAVYTVFFEAYLEDFLREHGEATPGRNWSRVTEVAERLKRGELVELGPEDRINDHYYHLYCKAVDSLARGHTPSTFRHMATLGKSASSAFYRRQLKSAERR